MYLFCFWSPLFLAALWMPLEHVRFYEFGWVEQLMARSLKEANGPRVSQSFQRGPQLRRRASMSERCVFRPGPWQGHFQRERCDPLDGDTQKGSDEVSHQVVRRLDKLASNRCSQQVGPGYDSSIMSDDGHSWF